MADNASDSEVRSYLAAATASSRRIVVWNDTNLGVAGGRNSAFSRANGEFLLSIDDDTRLCYEILGTCRAYFVISIRTSAFSVLRVRHPHDGSEQNYAGEHEGPVANHHGAAFAVRCEVLARIGGMDDYCDFGIEELDICVRTHAAGFQILYTPELVVYHNSFRRPGKEGLRRQRQWLFNSSRTMFMYFPLRMACMFSTRYFLWATRGVALRGRVVAFARFLLAHLRGCWVGLRHQDRVPRSTVVYYAGSQSRPRVWQ